MLTSWPNLRQRVFPAPFRINVGPADALADSLTFVIAQAGGARPGAPPEQSQPQAVNTAFAVALCNYHFRMGRNAGLLKDYGDGARELRAIGRALEKIDALLKDYGIECRDVTGQRYDDGREDFELIGRAEKVPGLGESKITQCECPVVLINGKLVQKAKGLVSIPA
jgi:hypothetical protein